MNRTLVTWGISIIAAVWVQWVWVAAPVVAQGACCLMSGCEPAGDEAECSGMGGVFLPGEECADDPCGVGACCSDVACVMTDAYSCITAGRDFMGAGTDCADDPCEVGTGACCLDGQCEELTPEQCEGIGGVWLGFGTICGSQGCELGACCVDDDCVETAHYECDALGGVFVAEADCASHPCGVPNECPANSLYSQSRDWPEAFSAYTSESSAGFRRYDDFAGVAGAIDGVFWWGLDLEWMGGGGWTECVESDNTFEVSFHEDAGGVPGEIVCSYTLPATRTPTGIYYLGAELNEYSLTLPAPCVQVNGWVSIVGRGDADCWFLWMSAGAGASYCDGCVAHWEPDDLSFCLLGTAGGVFGACCDEPTGDCADDVEITACLEADQIFAPDGRCADFDPPCGVIPGACCFDDATCSLLTEADCQALGGEWLGGHTPCWLCPCLTPCPPGGVAEGEPVCHDGYDDVFNAGCDAPSPTFSPISFCQTVCGESGVFTYGGDFVGDFDWYEIVVDAATQLTWTIEAEYPVGAWIVDGRDGCAGAVTLAADSDFECTVVSASTFVQPGTYWLVTAPTTASDLAQCGAHYTATVTSAAPCAGDMDGDGDIDLDDLPLFVAALLAGDYTPAADMTGDGLVNGADIPLFVGALLSR